MSSLPKTGAVMLRASDLAPMPAVMRITVRGSRIADCRRGNAANASDTDTYPDRDDRQARLHAPAQPVRADVGCGGRTDLGIADDAPLPGSPDRLRGLAGSRLLAQSRKGSPLPPVSRWRRREHRCAGSRPPLQP